MFRYCNISKLPQYHIIQGLAIKTNFSPVKREKILFKEISVFLRQKISQERWLPYFWKDYFCRSVNLPSIFFKIDWEHASQLWLWAGQPDKSSFNPQNSFFIDKQDEAFNKSFLKMCVQHSKQAFIIPVFKLLYVLCRSRELCLGKIPGCQLVSCFYSKFWKDAFHDSFWCRVCLLYSI